MTEAEKKRVQELLEDDTAFEVSFNSVTHCAMSCSDQTNFIMCFKLHVRNDSSCHG